MDMIEKVARAMAEKMDGDTWDVKCEDGDGHGYMGKNEYRTMALAAMEAIWEPSAAMIEAGVTADHGKTLGERVANCHRAMIDRALSGDPS